MTENRLIFSSCQEDFSPPVFADWSFFCHEVYNTTTESKIKKNRRIVEDCEGTIQSLFQKLEGKIGVFHFSAVPPSP